MNELKYNHNIKTITRTTAINNNNQITNKDGVYYNKNNQHIMQNYINRQWTDSDDIGLGYRKTILQFSDLKKQYKDPLNQLIKYNTMTLNKLYNETFLLQRSFLASFNRANYRKIYNLSLSHLLQYRIGLIQIGVQYKPLPFTPLLQIGNISGNQIKDVLLSTAANIPFLPYALQQLRYLGSNISRNKNVVRKWLEQVYLQNNTGGFLYKTNKVLQTITGISFDHLPRITRVQVLSKLLKHDGVTQWEHYANNFNDTSNRDIFIYQSDPNDYHNQFNLDNLFYDVPLIKIWYDDDTNTNNVFQSKAYISNLAISRGLTTTESSFVGGTYPIIYNTGTQFTTLSFNLTLIVQSTVDIDDHIKKINYLQRIKTFRSNKFFISIPVYNIIDKPIQFKTLDLSIPSEVTWHVVYDDESKLNQYKDYISNLKNKNNKNNKIIDTKIKKAIPNIMQCNISCVFLDPEPFEWSLT